MNELSREELEAELRRAKALHAISQAEGYSNAATAWAQTVHALERHLARLDRG